MPKDLDKRCIPAEKLEEMYQYYARVHDTGGQLEVSRHFGRHRSNISRIARRERWEERYFENKRALQREADRIALQKEVNNLEIIRSVKNASVERILERLKKDPDFVPSLGHLVELIRLEEELRGNIPSATAGNFVANVNIVLRHVEQLPEEKRVEYRKLMARHWGV